MPAPEHLLLQQAGALEAFVLECEHQRRAHVPLVLLEQRKRLLEEFAQALRAVPPAVSVRAHRRQALADHRADELAAALEVAVGGGARHAARTATSATDGTRPLFTSFIASASSRRYVRARGPLPGASAFPYVGFLLSMRGMVDNAGRCYVAWMIA